MAVSQEIFRANVVIEMNIAQALLSLDSLEEKLSSVTATLHSLGKTRTGVDDSGISSITQAIEDATRAIRDDFEQLSKDVVGGSIIPEMMDQIAQEFKSLPDKTDPAFDELKRQFKSLGPIVRSLGDEVSKTTRDTTMDLERMAAELLKVSGRFTEAEIAEALKKISEAGDPAAAAVETATRALSKFHQQVAELKDEQGMRQTAEEAAKTAEAVSDAARRIGAIGTVGAKGFDTFSSKMADLKGGLALIRSEGGNTAMGLRQAMFGAGESTSIFARALDRLGDRTLETSAAMNRFAQEAQRMADAGQQQTRAMRSQVDQIKNLGKAIGVPKAELNELDGSVGELNREFGKLFTTIESGGAPTAQQLSRVRLSARSSMQEIQQLRASLGDLMPPELAKQLDALEQNIQTNARRLELATTNAQAYRKEQKKVARASRESARATEEQADSTKRFQISLKGIFNIFKRSGKSIDSTTTDLRQMNRALKETSIVSDVAKGAFLGFVGGAAATRLVEMGVEAIGNALRGMGREFFAVNDVMQNFGVTVGAMLSGSGVDVEAAITGSMDFIKEQVATTPFELADAVESFQKLVIAGFDPEQWLRPVADASAALNKPMDQLIGAFQRLAVGDTGQAIAMIRDFGINVNTAGAFVDKATGEMLDLEDAQAKYADQLGANATFQDMANAGLVEFSQLQFKNGQLITDTAETLDILNGFLRQNATFAGAAEARSQTLGGVISNLKDFMSNLFMEMGEPVFEKLTAAGVKLLGTLDAMAPTLNILSAQIGDVLGKAIDFATNLIFNLKDSLAGIQQTIGDIVAFVSAIFSGDWSNAFNVLLQVVYDTLGLVEGAFGDFMGTAVDWGFNLVAQIVDGIIDAANSILMDALSWVGDTVADFLAPGSPPQKGPLSDIDTWGVGVMDTYLKSFTKADFGFIKSALAPIKAMFTDLGTKKGLKGFQSVRQSMVAITDELNKTGEINQKAFGKIASVLGEENKHLTEYLRLQLELQKAQRKLSGIQEEVAEAEARGFIPAELKKRAAAAKADVEQKQEAVAWQKEYVDFQKESQDIQKDIVKAVERAARAMEQAAKATMKAASRQSKAAKKAARSQRTSQAKQQESLEEWYAREKALTEEKFRLGVIGEKEYTQSLLKIEKKYVDRALKEGVVSGLEEHASAISELEARLLQFKGRAGKVEKEALDIPTPAEIFAGFAKDSADAGKEIGISLFSGVKESLLTSIPNLKKGIWEKVRAIFSDVISRLRKFLDDNITPENFGIFATITGIIASLLASPIFKFFQKLLGPVTKLARASGGFTKIFSRLVSIGLKFSLIGAAILLVFQNWGEIVAFVKPILEEFVKSIRESFSSVIEFVEKLLASEGFKGALENVKETIDTIVAKVGEIIGIAAEIIQLKIITIGTDAIEYVGEIIDSLIEGMGGADAAATKIGDALEKATEIIGAFSTEVLDAVGLLIQGDFSGAWDSLLDGLSGLTDLLPDAGELFSKLGEAIFEALPPQLQETLSELAEAVRGFFEEGRLGGELVVLFGSLRDLIVNAWPAIKVILTALGGIIALVAGIIGNILLSALQTIIDVLPLIERLLSGVIRIFSGWIDIFSSVILAMRGFVALIKGIFTGDFQPAIDLFQQAWAKVFEGVGKLISGFGLMISAALGLIVGVVVSFFVNFITNITDLIGGGAAKWGQKLTTFKDNAIASFVNFADGVFQALVDLPAKIIALFTNLATQLIGESIITDMVTNIIAAIASLATQFIQKITDLVASLLTKALEFIAFGTEVVASIQTGVSDAWVAFTTSMDSHISSIITTILLRANEFIAAGQEFVAGIREGIESNFEKLVTWFEDQVSALVAPIETVRESITSIFGGLEEELVTKSIVPDTTEGIIKLFSNMGDDVDRDLTSFSRKITATWGKLSSIMLMTWKRSSSAILATWQTTTGEIVEITDQMADSVLATVDSISDALVAMGNSAATAKDSLGKIPGVLKNLEGKAGPIWDLNSAFVTLGTGIGNVVSQAEVLLGVLEAIAAISLPSIPSSENGGGGPTAQRGAWNVGKGLTLLHTGETVLPPTVAEAFRGFVGALNSAGIGGKSFNLGLPAMGLPGGSSETAPTQNFFGADAFRGAFPNVRDGRDAGDFMRELDRRTSLAELRGRVVG